MWYIAALYFLAHVSIIRLFLFFFFQAEAGIRDHCVTGVQTCALPIYWWRCHPMGVGHVWKTVARRETNSVAPRRAILAHTTACHLYRVGCAGRLHARERLPALHPRLTSREDSVGPRALGRRRIHTQSG